MVSFLVERLGLPETLDEAAMTELLEARVALGGQVARLQRELEEEQGRAEGLEGRVEEMESSLTCPICFAEVGDQVLDPCGHRLCGSCLAQIVGGGVGAGVCPMCRVGIEKALKVFL